MASLLSLNAADWQQIILASVAVLSTIALAVGQYNKRKVQRPEMYPHLNRNECLRCPPKGDVEFFIANSEHDFKRLQFEILLGNRVLSQDEIEFGTEGPVIRKISIPGKFFSCPPPGGRDYEMIEIRYNGECRYSNRILLDPPYDGTFKVLTGGSGGQPPMRSTEAAG